MRQCLKTGFLVIQYPALLFTTPAGSQSARSHGVADLDILFSRIGILGTSWAQLVTIFKKPICRSPSRGYFVACTEAEKQEALHYLDSVLTEVGDRRRALAETDPLERQERLF